MGDYQYTELSYKITSLILRICCLCSSGFDEYVNMEAEAIYMRDSYRRITKKYARILKPVDMKTTNTFLDQTPILNALVPHY
mgnify:FL=1